MNEIEKKLYDDILNASNVIAKKARTGPGDFVITSPAIVEMYEQIIQEQKRQENIRKRRLKIEKLKNKLNG
jgi:hypothetical protein